MNGLEDHVDALHRDCVDARREIRRQFAEARKRLGLDRKARR